mmetsp:Transcript_13314/g.37632  ORF Transcript_13314/g.37632 Transcript_13314/m.37632 type:complete len:653 (+) Transcript_13314:77-2035(+)
MVRFAWQVDAVTYAYAERHKVSQPELSGCFTVPISIEMIGRADLRDIYLTLPPNYLQPTNEASATAVLIANCGRAGKGIHSFWHKKLCVELASAGHVVASCNCDGSSDHQDLVARKTVETCSKSPYGTGIRRWFFIGVSSGSHAVCRISPSVQSSVAGLVLMTYAEEPEASAVDDNVNYLMAPPVSSAQLEKLQLPILLVQRSQSTTDVPYSVAQAISWLKSSDVRMILVASSNQADDKCSKHHQTHNVKGLVSAVRDFVAAACSGDLQSCKLLPAGEVASVFEPCAPGMAGAASPLHDGPPVPRRASEPARGAPPAKAAVATAKPPHKSDPPSSNPTLKIKLGVVGAAAKRAAPAPPKREGKTPKKSAAPKESARSATAAPGSAAKQGAAPADRKERNRSKQQQEEEEAWREASPPLIGPQSALKANRASVSSAKKGSSSKPHHSQRTTPSRHAQPAELDEGPPLPAQELHYEAAEACPSHDLELPSGDSDFIPQPGMLPAMTPGTLYSGSSAMEHGFDMNGRGGRTHPTYLDERGQAAFPRLPEDSLQQQQWQPEFSNGQQQQHLLHHQDHILGHPAPGSLMPAGSSQWAAAGGLQHGRFHPDMLHSMQQGVPQHQHLHGMFPMSNGTAEYPYHMGGPDGHGYFVPGFRR